MRVAAREEDAPVNTESAIGGHDTVGARAMNWIRRQYGVLNAWEPPIVLNLEALGDTASETGVTVRLDLDDATKSVAFLGR